MPRQQKVHLSFDFSGGLNTGDAAHLVKPNELTLCRNVFVGTSTLAKRAGLSLLSPEVGVDAIRGLFRIYKYAATNINNTIATYATTIAYRTGTPTWAAVTGGTAPVTGGTRWSGAVVRSDLWLVDGTNQSYVVTNAATPTKANANEPANKCKYVAFLHQRVWEAGANATPSSLYFTDLEGSTFPVLNELFIPSDRPNNRITGLTVWRNRLIVMTNEFPVLLYGFTIADFNVVPIVDAAPGCSAPYSIASGGGVIFYAHKTGLYMFNGANSYRISDKIASDLGWADVALAGLAQARGIIHDDAYWFFYRSTDAAGSVNRRALVYTWKDSGNPFQGVWTGPHTLSVDSAVVFDGEDDNGELYVGTSEAVGTTNAVVGRLDDDTILQDNGANYKVRVDTGELLLEDPGALKYLDELELHAVTAKGGTIDIWYSVDNETFRALRSVPQAPTERWEGERSFAVANRKRVVYPVKFPPSVAGRYVKLRFEHDASDDFELLGYILRYSVGD